MPDLREPHDDADLLQAWRDKQQWGADALCSRHDPNVRRVCFRLAAQTSDAEDAAHSTWVEQGDNVEKSQRYVDQFRERPYRPYLLTCARNRCIDLHRTNARFVDIASVSEGSTNPTDDDPATPETLRQVFSEHAAAAKLTDEEAEVLFLSMLGFKAKEIGQKRGLTPAAVRQAKHRARGKLRPYWRRKGV